MNFDIKQMCVYCVHIYNDQGKLFSLHLNRNTKRGPNLGVLTD